MKRIVTFGEVMLRVGTPLFRKFPQAFPGQVDATFAGAEANVAASLANLGAEVSYVTALPKHAVADACLGDLRRLGVDLTHVVRTDDGRLGVFYLETGANQRPSRVIYDRDHSAISRTPASAYAWEDALRGAGWLHLSGITPALSAEAAETTVCAAQTAKRMGVAVSCDLNFREKLWRWGDAQPPRELAEATMRRVLPSVDLVIANEEDFANVLGLRAGDTDVHSGSLEIDRYPSVAAQAVEEFPELKYVAITLRESKSATHNDWGAMLYEAESTTPHFAPLEGGEYRPYPIRNIVDRVGGGDSFAAALIFALASEELRSAPDAIAFATASSCLAHSIAGDFNYTTRAEVESLLQAGGSGRVQR